MRALLPLVTASIALAGCGQTAEVHADKGYVRLAAVPGRPAAAYFTLHGGQTDTTLVSVTSPVVIKTEIHETSQQGRAMTMAMLKQVPLPAKATIPFTPGGKHVMLFNVNPGVKPGGTMGLILSFSNGLQIEYDAPIIAAGDAPPAS